MSADRAANRPAMTAPVVLAPVVLAAGLAWLLLFRPEPPGRAGQREEPPAAATADPAGRTPSLTLAEIRLPAPPSTDAPPIPGVRAKPEPTGALASRAAGERTEEWAEESAPEPPRRTAPEGGGDAVGEAVLRAVAAGEGPDVTLLWPRAVADRRRLAGHLLRCGGLAVALMAGGRLWRLDDPAGRPWNWAGAGAGAGFSPLLRRADGHAAEAGEGLAARIRRHHGLPGGLRGGALVTLVSRAYDRRLLGGLARLIPQGRPVSGQVTAAYALEGERLFLTDIRVDGRPLTSRIALGRIGRCG